MRRIKGKGTNMEAEAGEADGEGGEEARVQEPLCAQVPAEAQGTLPVSPAECQSQALECRGSDLYLQLVYSSELVILPLLFA